MIRILISVGSPCLPISSILILNYTNCATLPYSRGKRVIIPYPLYIFPSFRRPLSQSSLSADPSRDGRASSPPHHTTHLPSRELRTLFGRTKELQVINHQKWYAITNRRRCRGQAGELTDTDNPRYHPSIPPDSSSPGEDVFPSLKDTGTIVIVRRNGDSGHRLRFRLAE